MDKKKLVKIIIPVCIVLVIASIWVIKNYDFKYGITNNSFGKQRFSQSCNTKQ
jgi:hypothetical protein